MTAGGRALAVALAVLVAPGAPAAEAPAQLVVTVRDNEGVVPGATVRVTNHGTGAAVRRLSDGAGTASFSLVPGTYSLRAEFTGFADHSHDVTLAAGEERAIGVALLLPQFSTAVTVTTVNRREELLLNVANPTTVIDVAQIEDTGARSAKDVLIEQNGNGIEVHPGGGQGHVSINGIPNSGVLVLIDGRRYLGRDANGNLNLEDLQVGDVERIEVVKGAGSALYGADALGGVINFITRQARAPGITNRLDLTGGSRQDFRAGDTFGYRAARGGFALSGGYRTFDGFDLDDANPQTIGQPESRWLYGSGRADLELSRHLVGRFSGDYQRRDMEKYYFSGATQLASTVYDSQRELVRYTLSPELEFLLARNTSLVASFSYGKYLRDETRIFVVGGAVQPQAPWREWNRELRLTARHAWRGFGQENPLQGGYEFREEKLRRGALSRTDPERDISVFWLQQELNAGAKLKLTGGFRYDRYGDFGGEWSPKVSAMFAPAGPHRLRASYGHGFRAPYFGELYLNTPPFFVGNPDLEPEVSDTVTGGYAYAGGRVQGSADYSYARVKNGIAFFRLTPSRFTYDNVSRYTAQAVNLAITASLPLGFVPSVAYTWLERENEEGENLGSYPTNAVFLKLRWANPRWGLRANFRGQVSGDQPPSLTDSSTVPAYDVWYVQVQKRLLARGPYAWSAFVQVDNLFDEKRVFRRDARGVPLPNDFQVWLAPRAFLVGVTIDMDWAR